MPRVADRPTHSAVAQQTHNPYEPSNVPGAGQKLLAQFAGDWQVAHASPVLA
ncbi:MAG: hypothetical protein WBX38_09760 [Candidatus Sulfotelmatobacter sp.]